MFPKKVAVLVAGSWGAALASLLANNGLEVVIWSRNEAEVEKINSLHQVKDFQLGVNIQATNSIHAAVVGADAIVLAAPSSGMREVVSRIKPYVSEDTLLIHAAKGFEADSLKRMTTVIAEELPQYDAERIVVLSGPSHAEEVILRCPTTVVVAAQQMKAAEAAQDLFINSYFRVYTNPDVVGVEVGGALKNIIALGAGMMEGLGFGDNAKAALMTRGLAEISRLGTAMGANPLTFAGLAGVGDLIVTCTSKHSRNWRAGFLLGQSIPLDKVLEQVGMVVEGVKTTKAAYALAHQYRVTMPITVALYQVLFAGKRPLEAVEELMQRERTYEIGESLY